MKAIALGGKQQREHLESSSHNKGVGLYGHGELPAGNTLVGLREAARNKQADACVAYRVVQHILRRTTPMIATLAQRRNRKVFPFHSEDENQKKIN